MKSSAVSWVEVVRLRTLPAAIAPVLLGTGVAFALGAASWARALLAAGVALALQIGCNIANDYFDGLRGVDDVRCGPPRLTASGAVAPAAVMALALASFAVAVALGLALLALCGQWWMLGLGAAAIAAAWFYTGGPRPYGYRGLGEVFVFLFFGLMATCGTTYVQAGRVPLWGWVAGAGVGLIACALLMVNNLRDIHTDPVHGKITLAVRLGERRARQAFMILLIAPCLLGLLALAGAGAEVAPFFPRPGMALLMAVLLALWGLMVRRAGRPVLRLAIGRDLAPSLRDAGLYELLYSLSLTGALVALVALV